MIELSLSEVVDIVAAAPVGAAGEVVVDAIATDSRDVPHGRALFVALRTDRADGHDHAVAAVGRVPQCRFERVQRAREGPDPRRIRPPVVLPLLPGDPGLHHVVGEGSVPEVAALDVAPDGVEHGRRRVEVHVGNPRRDDVRPVSVPLDADTRPTALFVRGQQSVRTDHDLTVVPRRRSAHRHGPRRTGRISYTDR